MTIDDLLTAVRIAEPQLSPDSRTVVYTRTTTDLPWDRRNADLGERARRRRNVPVDQGLQMFTVLRRSGVAAEALVFADEGHGCSARTTAACGSRRCSAG